MSFKPEDLGTQAIGAVCSAGTAIKLFITPSDSEFIENLALKILIVVISGIIGGAASMLGKYLMRKFLSSGSRKQEEDEH